VLCRSAARRAPGLAAAVVLAVVGVLAAPGAALAGTTLVPYQPATEPTPVTVQQFGFDTTSHYWSAVGIKPRAGADDDLVVSDASGVALDNSDRAAGEVDVVAVNSNLRPLGGYQATVNRYAGSGDYQIELAQGLDSLTPALPASSQTVAMHGGFLAVRDLYLRQGDVYEISILAHTLGVAGYVLASDAKVSNLDQAVASCRSAATPNACTLIYTPDRSGWNGLVLVSLGAGDLTVTASEASPSPPPVAP
jgi:hypothetical protein